MTARFIPPSDLRKQYEDGAGIDDLATKYNCRGETIAKYIRLQGGTIRTAAEQRKLRRKKPPPLTPELIAEIKKKYPQPGYSIPRLQRETGIPQKDIRQLIIDDPNIQLKKRGGQGS